MGEIQRWQLGAESSMERKQVGADPRRTDWVAHDDHLDHVAAELDRQAEEHRKAHDRVCVWWSDRMDALEAKHAAELAEKTKTHIAVLESKDRYYHGKLAELRGELFSLDRDIAEEHGEPALMHFVDGALIGEPCMVHRDFEQALEKLCDIARGCEVKLWVTHSIRYLDQDMLDLVVKKAKRSNHLAGSAVDLNPVYQGVWYTNAKMEDMAAGAPKPVQEFLAGVVNDPTLRWGGQFGVNKDLVHFDSNLVLRDPVEWARRVEQLREERNA